MENYLGEIKVVTQNFAPRGWAFCNGQLLSIQQNAALFSLLGTTYGGNGTTNFGLPNLQCRVPLNFGQSVTGTTYQLGQVAGTESVTLTIAQLPMHTHSMAAYNGAGNSPSPINTYFSQSPSGDSDFSTSVPNVTMSPKTLSMVGGSSPVPIMQPYLALNFIIALTGIYPSRN